LPRTQATKTSLREGQEGGGIREIGVPGSPAGDARNSQLVKKRWLPMEGNRKRRGESAKSKETSVAKKMLKTGGALHLIGCFFRKTGNMVY